MSVLTYKHRKRHNKMSWQYTATSYRDCEAVESANIRLIALTAKIQNLHHVTYTDLHGNRYQ